LIPQPSYAVFNKTLPQPCDAGPTIPIPVEESLGEAGGFVRGFYTREAQSLEKKREEA